MKRETSFVNPTLVQLGDHGISRSLRDAPPAHYIFRIDSFSGLLESEMDECESKEFQVDGYMWKLILYPNGDENVKDYISLHLAICNEKSLPTGWEANVSCRFSVFDKIRDKYLSIQDAANGGVYRFHKLNTEKGISHLLSQASFNDVSNGYLHKDCCTFGVEIFVINGSNTKGESLKFVSKPQASYYTWKFYGFSSYCNKSYRSETFTVNNRKWHLSLFPKGETDARSPHLSIFLGLDEAETLLDKKLYVKFNLRMRDHFGDKRYEKIVSQWFTTSSRSWGFKEFFLLSDLKDQSQNFLVEDCLIIECKILVVSEPEDL